MTRLRLVGIALLALVLTAGGTLSAPAGAGDVPTREQWLQDVNQVMKGSTPYLRERTADGDPKLAINLDIDNSAVMSYYDGKGSGAIPRILRFAKRARKLGVFLVFNTGRPATMRKQTLDQLAAAGYEVKRLCMRQTGETLAESKPRCRNQFIDKGFTLIANVGNNPTDFAGGGYEKAYRLPNYGSELP